METPVDPLLPSLKTVVQGPPLGATESAKSMLLALQVLLRLQASPRTM